MQLKRSRNQYQIILTKLNHKYSLFYQFRQEDLYCVTENKVLKAILHVILCSELCKAIRVRWIRHIKTTYHWSLLTACKRRNAGPVSFHKAMEHSSSHLLRNIAAEPVSIPPQKELLWAAETKTALKQQSWPFCQGTSLTQRTSCSSCLCFSQLMFRGLRRQVGEMPAWNNDMSPQGGGQGESVDRHVRVTDS